MSLDSFSIGLTSEGMNPTKTAHWQQSALVKTTIGAMMISFSAVWVRLAQVAPTVSAFYRVGFGAVFLLIILIVRRQSLWQGRSVLGLSLIAALFFALDLYAWHRCIGYVGPGLATILGNFEVFLVPVVGLMLYKERLSLRFVLAVPLAVIGLFMIVGVRWDQLSPDYRIGIGWGLATAVFYTGFLVSLRRLQARPSPPSAVLSLMIVSTFSAIYLAADIIGNGESFAIPTIQSGLALVALGFFSQTAGWLLITHSLPRIPAAIAGLLLLLQPSLAFVWDVLFLEEKPLRSPGLGWPWPLAPFTWGQPGKTQPHSRMRKVACLQPNRL